jgi:hypothetical protein
MAGRYRYNSLHKGRTIGADMIGAEALKRLQSSNIQKLSLEAALELKDLVDLGAGSSAYSPQMLTALNGPMTTRRIYATLSSELNSHIDSLYELEAAPDHVKALQRAYKNKSKLHQEIEELKEILTAIVAAIDRSSRESSLSRSLYHENIKRSEEGSKMMLEELQQKTKIFALVEKEIGRLESDIKELKKDYLASHKRPVENINGRDKCLAWYIVNRAISAAAQPASDRVKMSYRGPGHRKSREDMEAEAEQRWAETDGAEAMRWAEHVQGVVLPPPPPRLSKIPLSAYMTAEEKALRALNRRESRNAAAAIFSNISEKNKPKWGIPNLGTGFGGGRTRRNSRKRRG